MGRSKFFVFVISVVSLFLLVSCATLPQSSSSKEEGDNKVSLAVASMLKFDDIPVPSGFKLLDKESFAFQNDRSRVALLKYIGPKPADNVMDFFKEQMAQCNWDLINITEYEKKVLNYENSYESCIISIEPQGGKSFITIALSQKSKGMKDDRVREK